MNNMNFFKRYFSDRVRVCRFCAFWLTALIMTLGYALRGIAPFGETSLMSMDAWGQYYPMLKQAERAFLSGERYSLAGALGFDTVAQGAYYTNSPLWRILFLLPCGVTPAGVDLVVLLRFALAGWSFAVYLTGRDKQGEMLNIPRMLGIVACSAAYALSGYTLAFINQFMWMDAVWLLPLVILGLERMYDGRRGVLYVGALALTIYSNFYIAYMVCIFCVLWFVGLCITRPRGEEHFFGAVGRFTLTSLLAGLVNAPVLLAVARAVGNTLASELTFDRESAMHEQFGQMWRMLLPFNKPSLEYGLPNLYFGLLCALLILPAVFSPKIKLRCKLAVGVLLAFLWVSFGWNVLDFFWHGMHFPNQLPGRQSFLFIFTALVAAHAGFRVVVGMSRARWVTAVLAVVMTAEVSVNACVSLAMNVRTFGAAYVAPLEKEISEFRDILTPDTDSGEFFRTELLSPRDNGGQLYGYAGISYYSSTMSGDAYRFFTQLGLPIYARNVSVRYESCPILDTLFGVRYLISETEEHDPRYQNIARSHESGIVDEDGNVIEVQSSLCVIENRTALPLAYLAHPAVLEVDMSLRGHALRNDLFCRAAGCEDVIDADGNWDIEVFLEGAARLREGAMDIDSIRNGQIVGSLDAARNGVLMMSLPAADIRVFVDGEEVEVLEICGYMGGVHVKRGAHEVKIVFK